MDAKLYVYAYVLLSALYGAGCIQYVNALGRTASLAKSLRADADTPEVLALESDDVRDATRSAVRAVLSIDSAGFGVAVLPVAYVAVTGVLANVISRNTAAASTLNPMWLVATVALVAAHLVFLVRIIGLNTKMRDMDDAVLSGSFVSRHTSMFAYYRWFVLAVTLFNVVNTIYILATLATITSLPYVGLP
ncbi:MAG TPA: hypothetical protein VF902_05010 [Coriobacteriia bacterium]